VVEGLCQLPLLLSSLIQVGIDLRPYSFNKCKKRLWHRTFCSNHQWEGDKLSIFDLFLIILVVTYKDVVNTLQDGSTFGKFEGGKNESDVIDLSIKMKVRSLSCEDGFMEILTEPFFDGVNGCL
jgi:hypothetical protein